MAVGVKGRAGNRAGSLRLEAADLGPTGTPGAEDILLNMTASVGGYAAADQVWIPRSEADIFLAQLATLDRDRRGAARLRGATPEEFELTFYSTDRVGHLAVRGHVRQVTPEGYELALRFAFGFEPDQLPRILDEFCVLLGGDTLP